ncbi:MAG: TetR/AcrR family transcriptional regulator, partial [Acidobacteriota bacterium]
ATSKKQRRPQRRGIATRDRLIEAALRVFAARGFEGATTREIAQEAGVALAALTYHFESKDELWRCTADRFFLEHREHQEQRIAGLEGVDAATVARLVLRDLVRSAAQNPDLHRFVMQEGMAPTPRLEWLVERHVRPQLEILETYFGGEVGRASGFALNGSPALLHYLLVGTAAAIYVQAPEFELLTGESPREPKRVEEHLDAVMALFFPGSEA